MEQRHRETKINAELIFFQIRLFTFFDKKKLFSMFSFLFFFLKIFLLQIIDYYSRANSYSFKFCSLTHSIFQTSFKWQRVCLGLIVKSQIILCSLKCSPVSPCKFSKKIIISVMKLLTNAWFVTKIIEKYK